MSAWALRLSLALAAFVGAAVMEAALEKMITILHTNDIHGHIEAGHGWEGELAGKTIGGMDHLPSAIKKARASRKIIGETVKALWECGRNRVGS